MNIEIVKIKKFSVNLNYVNIIKRYLLS